MTREMTTKEVQKQFLDQVRVYIDYWDGPNVPATHTCRDRLEGLALSLLSILDGVTGLPAFIVAPDPHPDDKQDAIDTDAEFYWPENYALRDQIKADIAGD